MGTTFKYISDGALAVGGYQGRCEFCGQTEQLFPIMVNDENAPSSPGEVCGKCIKTVPLSWIAPKGDERLATTLVNQKHPKGTKSQDQRFALTVELADEFRRTPDLPTFEQADDWPRCCGDFSEFLGEPGRGYRGALKEFEWRGDTDHIGFEDGIEVCAESDGSVNLFACHDCGKKFWVFQMS